MVTALSDLLNRPASEVAPRLLGCLLRRELDGHTLLVKIVETEAYDQSDAASHSYRGQTPRNEIMFGPAGRLYVYFTYGMHYCCNVVCGGKGQGAAVLIRAVEPLEGIAVLSSHRHGLRGESLTNGPAKLCQALGIDKALDGHRLDQAPLELLLRPIVPPSTIIQTTRIGISQGIEVPWRYYLKGNRYVSRPL